jgi:type II secretion system protein G
MNRKAFTLIELLIVIMILGVLAALITGNFFTSLKKGRDSKRKADLEQISRALEMYYEDKRAYPTFNIFAQTGYQLCGSGLVAPSSSCTAGEKAYMLKMPNDPISGKDYEYLSSDGTDYKLFTCLENKLQILPYESTESTLTCGNCRNPTDTADVECVWGISSSNISP